MDEHSLDQLKAYRWRCEKETHTFRTEKGPVTVTGWFSRAPYEFLRAPIDLAAITASSPPPARPQSGWVAPPSRTV